MSDQAHPALPIKAAQLRLSNLAASQLPLPGASPADVERLSPTRLTAAKRSASRRGCLGQLLGSPRGGTVAALGPREVREHCWFTTTRN